MRSLRKFLYIEYRKSGIGYSLSEDCTGIRTECGIKLIPAAVGRYEGDIYAHLCHGNGDKIECAAVYGGGGYYMTAALAYIKQSKEVCRLT